MDITGNVERFNAGATGMIKRILILLWIFPVVAMAEFVPHQLLVKFKTPPNNVRIVQHIKPIGWSIIELPPQTNERAQVNIFRARDDVEKVELNYIHPLNEIPPNDTYYVYMWHLHGTGVFAGDPNAHSHAEEMWALSQGCVDILIGNVDTGVNTNLPDLWDKSVLGWNSVEKNHDTSDANGHGTRTAHTMAAIINNGIDTASPCSLCSFMPLRATATSGANSVNIAEAIIYAADHGVRIVSVNFGVPPDNQVVTSAAAYMVSHAGLVFQGSGNFGTYEDTPDNPFIIHVSGTTNHDLVPNWVDHGPFVDLAAPAENIISITSSGQVSGSSGTSHSAPIAASIAGVIWSLNPDLSPFEVEEILEISADDIMEVGFDIHAGWGRVNGYQAALLAQEMTECLIDEDCTDNDICNGTENCISNLCVFDTPLDCNDGLFCNGEETCDPILGCQSGTVVDCNDGLFCNGTESCDPINGCVSSGNPCAGVTMCNEIVDICEVLICDNDGICGSGEDCHNCPNDCRSKPDGKPNNRYCCDGDLPACGDCRCLGSGWSCEYNGDCAPCMSKNGACISNTDCCSNICKNNGRCR